MAEAFYKIHKMMKGRVGDPDGIRTLCGRSSRRVVRVEDIAMGANADADDAKVNCKFCLRLLPNLKRKEN